MSRSPVLTPPAEQARAEKNGGGPARGRRIKPAYVALGITAIVVIAGGVYLAGDSGTDTTATDAEPTTTTAEVVKRDLVERESFAGTLGYANVRSVTNQFQGTVTELAKEGSTVKRGDVLFRVDGKAATLMYGAEPAYRELSSSTDDGEDVKQLEWNLVELGYDPGRNMTIDGEWTSSTTDAVERWQDDIGATSDGSVDFGEIVFLPGARRVGEHATAVGQSAQPGTEMFGAASTSQVVTMDLDANDQELIALNDEVEVELPGGDTVAGTISEVGTVAESEVSTDGTSSDPTIAITITLEEASSVALDQAPVDVNITKERRANATAVPVAALIALAGGGYAVEVPDGTTTRLVPVETGLFADGYVEVSGVDAGTTVVVPS